MTVFVTGGAGFIGSEFVRQMTPRVRLINFDKLTYAAISRISPQSIRHPNYSLVVGDVCDAAAVADAMPEDVDAVVHFAAESHVDRSILSAEEFVRTNVLGTQVMLDVARHARPNAFCISRPMKWAAIWKRTSGSAKTARLSRAALMRPARRRRSILYARRRARSAWTR